MTESVGKNFDFTHCERENLAYCGAIQPHGVYIAVDNVSRKPVAWSVNCGEILELSPDSDNPLTLAPQEEDALVTILASSRSNLLIRKARSNSDGISFDLYLHKNADGHIALEWEPATTGRPARNELNVPQSLQSGPMRAWIRALCETHGMDRGILYKFQPDQSGYVDVGWAIGDLETYEGLRYPATDIPQVARALYLNVASRHIADSAAEPVPVHTPNPGGANTVDLSLAELRAVSPYHLQYMRNMGVATSVSLPIIIDDQLWALLTFHRLRRQPVDLITRQSLEQAASDLKDMIAFQRIEKRMQIIDRRQRIINALTEAVRNHTQAEKTEKAAAELLTITECDGLATAGGEQTFCFGKTPAPEDIRRTVKAISAKKFSGTFVTDVADLDETAPADSSFPGVAAAWCSFDDGPGAILLFRRESTQTVVWGSRTRNSGETLSPAASFSRWQESMSGHSLPWSEDIFPWMKALQLSLQRTSIDR